MGQEITSSHFTKQDFEEYKESLVKETELLTRWFREGEFAECGMRGGFELEAWLVDKNFNPSPINVPYLEALDCELVSPELSKFNVELNGAPVELRGHALGSMHRELDGTWAYCREVAKQFDADLVMAGILPSVREEQMVVENMSRMKRYRALNEQVLRLREGKPILLDILGKEHLKTTHHDVMLESATTSYQIHLQVDLKDAVRFYNASVIASAATVAVAANSPYLFGKDLWDETRIPLFEQAVAVGGIDGAAFGPLRRVSFGSGYVRDSVLECFLENQQHFPVMLPMKFAGPVEEMNHVRLHNGTIWRWNRPLIGYEQDGSPHLRIEHRVVSAGPTIVDDIANSALYYGLVTYLASMEEPPEFQISFARARDNFYAAAKQGLSASVTWLQDHKGSIHTLLMEELLPLTRLGLQKLDIAPDEIDQYIGIIEERVRTGQNGAWWQREAVKKYGYDMQQLTEAYVEQQQTGKPVHEWTV